MTMAYSSSSLSSFPYTKPHTPPPTSTKKGLLPATAGGRGGRDGGNLRFSIKAVKSPESADPPATTTETETETPAAAPKPPKKPVYSMKKGQIVRVEKEKYLNSINYLSVGHPPYYKGLDYIYEDRGEVLDIRIFETGEYALIAWIGVPTAPAWLPTDMLIKSDKLDYERI
ncbi:NAD(P)H-quinone oxidoreductase subunit O, chloroplastic [Cynara cardunculus var. scolymus]|uniref:NAD(P)H-quinone oxidoreductase subunit O, chloroplastic n=1 Tax=Cynara cardunculus var. scolymus TaxID=59895 RepID=UPI000D62ED36|nr:NAD(P)H-quinone oxidoreductase subunit O, chloroplastic [Cynara cardunculus var. scolymus]